MTQHHSNASTSTFSAFMNKYLPTGLQTLIHIYHDYKTYCDHFNEQTRRKTTLSEPGSFRNSVSSLSFGRNSLASPRPASEAALLRDLTNIVNQRNEQLFILLQYTNALKKETLSENGGVNSEMNNFVPYCSSGVKSTRSSSSTHSVSFSGTVEMRFEDTLRHNKCKYRDISSQPRLPVMSNTISEELICSARCAKLSQGIPLTPILPDEKELEKYDVRNRLDFMVYPPAPASFQVIARKVETDSGLGSKKYCSDYSGSPLYGTSLETAEKLGDSPVLGMNDTLGGNNRASNTSPFTCVSETSSTDASSNKYTEYPISRGFFQVGDPNCEDFFSHSRSNEELNRLTSESAPFHTATQGLTPNVRKFVGVADMQMILQVFERDGQLETVETCEKIASVSSTTTVSTATDFDTCPSPKSYKSYDTDSIEQTYTVV